MHQFTKTLFNLSLAATAIFSDVALSQNVSLPPKAETQNLRVIDSKQVCMRMNQAFAQLGTNMGLDKVKSALLATNATEDIVAEFRAGRTTDFISTSALLKSANLPGPNNDNYLPLANLIGYSIGSQTQPSLALSVGELRFIPHAQRGMEIILIAGNTVALTPERSAKVAEVARSLNVKISVIWTAVETGPVQVEEARQLAWLAASTGGSFTNFGGVEHPCTAAIL